LEAHAGETFTDTDETFISISGVPEPGAWAMMLLGLGFGGAVLRSRRANVARA
jgi:hypothetical protein